MAVEKARARWTVPIRNLLFVCSLCVYGTLDGKLRTLFDIVDTARCGALSSTQVRVVRGECSCPKLLPCECVRANAALHVHASFRGGRGMPMSICHVDVCLSRWWCSFSSSSPDGSPDASGRTGSRKCRECATVTAHEE